MNDDNKCRSSAAFDAIFARINSDRLPPYFRKDSVDLTEEIFRKLAAKIAKSK